jgi:hypothetical protein
MVLEKQPGKADPLSTSASQFSNGDNEHATDPST